MNELDATVSDVSGTLDTGEYFIRLPNDILATIGWQVGDELEWHIRGRRVISPEITRW